MSVLILLLAIGSLWMIRKVWPVEGLSFIDSVELPASSDGTATMKILDVRDAMDYQHCHVPSSINISLGRLPFVWSKDLSPGESILIVSDSQAKTKKAARLLKKQGFERLYALRELHCA